VDIGNDNATGAIIRPMTANRCFGITRSWRYLRVSTRPAPVSDHSTSDYAATRARDYK